MPVWGYWLLFFVVGALAVAAAKRLDDLERARWNDEEAAATRSRKPDPSQQLDLAPPGVR